MYNAERYLDECIQSALDQTYPRTEIIAVDDGSTDSSTEILKGYADRIRVYRKENGGTASALNLGARRMSGDWFKWLSADDALKPHAVSTLAGAARSLGWPDDHIFYARCDYINERGRSAGRLVAFEPNYNRRSDFERNAILLRRFYGNGITSMFHRSVFDRCGPFDEAVGYAEDYEFWLRCCLLHGCRLRFVPRNIARYRMHGQSTTSRQAAILEDVLEGIRQGILAELPAGLRSQYIESLRLMLWRNINPWPKKADHACSNNGRFPCAAMGGQPMLANESFLPGLSSAEIGEMYDAEKDVRDRQKMLVAYHYKSGKSIKEAAEAAHTNRENARRWIADMRKRGEAALRHRKAPGAARILTRDQYIQLVRDVHRGPRACGFKTNTWSYALVHKHARKKFGVDIAYRTVVDNMHELRIVVKSPRTAHPREASPEERAEFRLETRKKVLAAARKGHLVLFLDEVFLQSYKNALRTLGIKGDRTTVPSSVERALLPLFGVVGDGFYYFMEADRANTAWFIKFSERVVELFGPVQFILDNASYHLSIGYEKHVEGKSSIIRHFTLKYTPNDNSAEGQWKAIKSALSNVPLRSRNHMSDTLGKAVRAGEVPPVAVFDYARVGTRRLSPSEARAIKAKIGKGEHFWYEETEPPGRIRLPTADEVRRAREEVLTPEMLERLPRRLAKSGLPEKYLANPPDILLKR